MAGGPGERWGNYLGVQKHYVEIEGQVLLRRLGLQVTHSSIGCVVFVMQPGTQDEFDVGWPHDPYPLWAIPSKRRGPAAIFELFDCRNPDDPGIWNHEGRTIMFFGDVWYSDECMKTILYEPTNDKELGFTWFARHRRAVGFSENSNKEIWAISFVPEAQPALAEAMRKCLDMYEAGEIKRCGGWEVYHVLRGLDPNAKQFGGGFVTIVDWTEDFDTPHDYKQWTQKRKEWHAHGR